MAATMTCRSPPRSHCSTRSTKSSRGGLPLISSDEYNCSSPRRSYSRSAVPKVVNHANNYFNPVRNQVYARYSNNDWAASNSAHYRMSDSERAQAEKARADAWQAVRGTDQKTRTRQAEATRKLNERVQDIDYWRNELDQEIRAIENEQENLKEHLRVLDTALQHSARPLQIAEECLMHRENRIGIDQVKDDVERSLVREVQIIKKCQQQMKKLLEKGCVQQKMNRAAQHECSKDLTDKTHCSYLDDKMHKLKNSSAGISYHPGVELVDNTMTIPHSWVRFTQENLARSQKMRALSEALRGEIDGALRACANAMWSSFNNVNNCLQARTQEVTNARNKLQAHLQRTLHEIFDCEKAIALLKKAIADKECPLKVAETRLDERTRRYNVELCNDDPMKTLQREVCELRDSIRNLKDKKRSAEIALNRLNNTKSVLEKDIAVKENSLQIDSKYCLGMRKSFPMDPKIGPIFNMPLTY